MRHISMWHYPHLSNSYRSHDWLENQWVDQFTRWVNLPRSPLRQFCQISQNLSTSRKNNALHTKMLIKITKAVISLTQMFKKTAVHNTPEKANPWWPDCYGVFVRVHLQNQVFFWVKFCQIARFFISFLP